MPDPSEIPTTQSPPRQGPIDPAALVELFPQLEIIEVLGQGGMGTVYKARQTGLDRLVALKILPPEAGRDPSFAERFNREARALARLHHPNIVMVHDCGQAGELYYLIMEYVDGTNLRGAMHTGRLDSAQALAIVSQVCSALQYAHDEGVVHRDIKPENILLDQRGRVKIADFGLVKMLRRGTDLTLTAPQQVMGTMHYMAPEQFERPTEVDHRADIYALGVVFYELLTGELPLGRFALPSEKASVDHRLDDIVLHALAKEPERRYQKVSDIGTAVEQVSSSTSPAPLPPPDPKFLVPGASSAGSAFASRYLTSRSIGIAYLFWLLCFVGICGAHRFYAGKWVTGIIWLLTGGCLFIGQVIDLLLIPGMIRYKNLEAAFMAEALARGTTATPHA